MALLFRAEFQALLLFPGSLSFWQETVKKFVLTLIVNFDFTVSSRRKLGLLAEVFRLYFDWLLMKVICNKYNSVSRH